MTMSRLFLVAVAVLVVTLSLGVEGAAKQGSKGHGEACRAVFGECDFVNKLLMCMNGKKCQCASGGIFGIMDSKGKRVASELSYAGSDCKIKSNKPCYLKWEKSMWEEKRIPDCHTKCLKDDKSKDPSTIGKCKPLKAGKGVILQVNAMINIGLPSLLVMVFALYK